MYLQFQVFRFEVKYEFWGVAVGVVGGDNNIK